MAPPAAPAPCALWRPSAARIASSQINIFTQALAAHCGKPLASYAECHEYSVTHPGDFWRFYLQYSRLAVQGAEDTPALSGYGGGNGDMMDARWFEGAQINYAEALLYPAAAGDVSGQTALIAVHENGSQRRLTYAELRAQTAAAAAALTAAGVCRGDRVAAIIGNVPEAVVLLCACAAIGAVFSSCSPDFGEQAAAARFGQIAPKLLFAQPAYSYQGKRYDITPMLRALAAATAGWDNTIFIADGGEEVGGAKELPPQQQWQQWLAAASEAGGAADDEVGGEGGDGGARLAFTPLPFDHPLYILYSSGTTGMPKAIVHRTGGIMLKHHSEQHLHSDIRHGDVVLYFTTCGWMMWNWLVSALMQGATLLLYEGSPAYPNLEVLWQIAAEHRLTFFGTSARYIQSCKAAGVSPRNMPQADLSALRTVASTGSPLSPAGFEWVYEHVKEEVHLASISGGTDIVGCFMLGNPTLPVFAGQIQVPALGVDVAAFSEEGVPLQNAPGELVCRVPFPSMPLKFWNDEDGSKYRAAYFSHYPNIWRHGDLITLTEEGGMIVHGRSDATLNPGGVRIGSADLYRPLERLTAIADAAAVGRKSEEGDDEEIWLFVVLAAGALLDDVLEAEIKAAIRAAASPRHVPRRIIAVSQLPRTRSGKTTEMAIADVVNGREVANRAVMANPEALDEIAAAVA